MFWLILFILVLVLLGAGAAFDFLVWSVVIAAAVLIISAAFGRGGRYY